MKISISKLRSMLITCTALHGGVARQGPGACVHVLLGKGRIKMLYEARGTIVAADHTFSDMTATPKDDMVKIRVREFNTMLRALQSLEHMQVTILVNKTHVIFDAGDVTRTLKRRGVEEKQTLRTKAQVIPFVKK